MLLALFLKASQVSNGVSEHDSGFNNQAANKEKPIFKKYNLLLIFVSTVAAPFWNLNLAKLKAFKELV